MMKDYLELASLSARRHRRENRMTVACIVLAVFLVTAIFGMADMYIRSQIAQVRQDNGDFHVGVLGVTDEEAARIGARPDVAAVSRYGVLPYEEDAPYTLFDHAVLVVGCDAEMMTDILDASIVEGRFPETTDEVMLTQNARDVYDCAPGDRVTITTPDQGALTYTVSGFVRDSAQTMSSDGLGAFLSTDAFRAAYAESRGIVPSALGNVNLDDVNSALYVQFEQPFLARRSIAALKEDFQLADDQTVENVKLLGLYGQSANAQLIRIYLTALVLGMLVLIAGILMIASSLNMRVAQRTEFYGMLRCLGATPKQVMRLVRREALRWCRTAIPIGVGIGMAVVWILCAVLRHLVPIYFAEMPVLAVSWPSVAAGVVLGFLTVRLAARAPAKRAARVSPLAAVSGNATDQEPVRTAAKVRHLRVETALGIHHARASRKNLVLVTASFAFSIILFLSFSVAVDMMENGLRPLKPWTADVSITSVDGTNGLAPSLAQDLEKESVVEAVYGRMRASGLAAEHDGVSSRADLVSYEAQQFDWAEDELLAGDIGTAAETPDAVLAVYQEGVDLAVGDTVTLTVNGSPKTVTVAGILAHASVVSENDTVVLICSEETFSSLTGADGYAAIDIQLTPDASDADVNAIRAQAPADAVFADDRLSNASARGTYYCFELFIYGFLVIIALITIFNVINSIAMSVSARMRQYGVYRALGLSERQLGRMLASEAAAYTVLGGVLGTLFGLVCHYLLFTSLITEIWGTAWTLPWQALLFILTVMAATCIVAVRRPLRWFRARPIVDTMAVEH